MTETNSVTQDNQSENPENKRGFLQEMTHRRVPQVLGIYLVGSWTFMEFLDSIIGRHNLSPYWADVTLLILIMMLPTVIILAYRHGAPGAQSWTMVEKAGIPVNLLGVIATLMINFADKDLGNRAEFVEGMTPDGQSLVVIRPKEEYRKRIKVGFFKLSGTSLDDHLKLGVSHALAVDLHQDPYTNAFHAAISTRPLIESGFTDMTAPLTLMLKIAQDNRIQYYLDGTLRETPDGLFQIAVNIYDVNDGKKLTQIKSTPQFDIFSAIDELTPGIKTAIGLPDFIIDESPDLPIEEQLTSDLTAYTNFISSLRDRNLLSNFQSGEAKLLKAIELDPSFAVALADLSGTYFNQTRVNEGLEILKQAEKHSYRLPVDTKFQLATFGNLFKGQVEQAKATLQQWLTLYPESIQAWMAKVNLHQIMNERELALEANDELLRLEPYAVHRYLTKGQMYVSMGELDKAIAAFKVFAEKNPSHASVHILLGDTYRRKGNFELSNQSYLLAQALETNSLQSERRLLENKKREGFFAEAEAGYLALIDDANSDITKYELSTELRQLYLDTGRMLDALDWFDRGYEYLKSVMPESNILMIKMFESWVYATAGEIERGQALLDEAEAAMERYDNDLYQVNVMIGQAMFNLFQDSSSDPSPVIDEVQERVAKFVGNGNDHTFQMMRGLAFHISEQHEKAIPYLRDYTANYPNQNLNLWIALGDSYLMTDQTTDAINVYEKLLLEYPKFPLAHFGLARAHFKEGNADLANESLEVALNGWASADERHSEKREALALEKQLRAN